MQVLNKLTREDALLNSWMKMNCQSIAALTAGAVKCWISQSRRQWERQGHKTSAGRQDWFHVRLPLKVRELIRASQTSMTTCTKCKNIIWRAGEQAGRRPACWTGNSWFNSNTERNHTGNRCRNELSRRNREILPGHVRAEWGRSKPGVKTGEGPRATTKFSTPLSATYERSGKMGLLLSGGLCLQNINQAKMFNTFFASGFTVRVCSQAPGHH